MAESDMHYNETQMINGQTGSDMAQPAWGMNGSNMPEVPLPMPGEGGSVDSGTNGNMNGNNFPVNPLPNPGEGGPVNSGSNLPVVPLPNPGEGGPVDSGSNLPTVPLPNPGEGGPVAPGPGWVPGGSVTVPWPIFPGQNTSYFGQVRFLNASTNTFPVTISVDNSAYAINSRFGTISNYDWITDGFHTVTVRRSSGPRTILLQQTFPFTAGEKTTIILVDSASGGLEFVKVADTGCSNLPFNSGCFRFANMSYSGSSYDLLLYGGEMVFRNVSFQQVTPYKRAVAGTYQFYVTNTNSFSIIQELPVIIIGAVTSGGGVREPLVSFDATIASGRNYTAYAIGNTWSSNAFFRVMVVED